MFVNLSPWLHQLQLKRTRAVTTLASNHETDVAIIGGGIAGVATAYFALKYTNKKVSLFEGGNIAHGATGHNGGFLATYFERSLASLVEEFGFLPATNGQRDVETAWTLLDELREAAGLQTPMWQFTGYAGCATIEELVRHLADNALRVRAGLPVELMLVSEAAPNLADIPADYRDLYTVVPQRDILSLLETNDTAYLALLPERKGCMNSALFTEEVVGYLLATYPDRFSLFEQTPVKRLVLRQDHVVLDMRVRRHVVAAKEVVLCTNGFENIHVMNMAGPHIDKKFHHLVRGIVGYMAGYTEPLSKSPIEISYLPRHDQNTADVYHAEPYFYLTRRPFELENKEVHNLLSIGGPEALMDDTSRYQLEHPYPEEAKAEINAFLHETYRHSPQDPVSYKFLWHGLMGFTPNGVRLIGPEPANRRLYYNLGCNGVGLLPSLYGGRRIARYLAGEKVEPSIFDPHDSQENTPPTPRHFPPLLRKERRLPMLWPTDQKVVMPHSD